MANFNNMQVTDRGRALQAKAQTGKPLVFTRVRIGSGSMSGQQISDMTALIDPKMWLTINKSVASGIGKHTVGATLNNTDVVTGFYFRELGVFARDPDLGEILYAYGNAGSGAEYIPAGGGPTVLEKQVDVITLIGNATNVSATLDESLVFPSRKEFEDHKEAAVLDHPDGSVTTAKLANGAANDDKIGDRTVSDATAPTTNTAKLTSLLSGFAHMIKAITGGATWRTLPGMSLAAIKTILDAATNAATANALIKRDANGRAKVAAPSATDDIARKAEVDAVQANLTTHAADTVKHITAAERTAWNAKADKNGTLQVSLNAEMWRGWKRYSSLAELGLTSGSTIDDIFAALPVNAILEYISPGQALPLYPFSGAMVKFTKVSSTRMNGLTYRGVTDDVKVFHSVYASEGTTKWSDWQSIAWSNGALQTSLNADMLDGYHASSQSSANTVVARGGSGEVIATRFTSNVATGTAPLTVASSTMVDKLNTEFWGGTKIYYGLSELGLANGTSMTDVLTAMQSKSIALITVDSNNSQGLGVTLNGSLLVIKFTSNRMFIQFNSLSGISWTGKYTGTTFDGWERVPNSNKALQVDLNADLLDGYHADKTGSGDTLVVRHSSGNIEGTRLVSTVAAGTSPLVVTSPTLVSNLNVDLLDGQHGSYYAPLASPAFTGTPTAPTPNINTNNNQIANTSFVNAYAVNMVSSGSSSDPNTTQEAYILTNHANSPGGGIYWHIQTYFYSNKTGNRAQFAIAYNGSVNRIMVRMYNNGWNAWREFSPLDSPNFTGIPTAETPSVSTNNARIATTEFVHNVKKLSTAIPSGDDLNNYQTHGSYTCTQSATAATLANTPTNEAFNLRVEKHAGTLQILTTYSATSLKQWMRNNYGGTWGDWVRVPLDDGVTYSNLKAGTATKLATARTIALTGGVTGSGTFDGSGNLSISTTVAGNAPTATKLATARNINGVAFDGSANITIPIPVTSVAGRTGTIVLAGTDIPAATTSARGTVQLSTATNSTSTTLAATASAVKAAYDRAEAAFQSASDGKAAIVGALTGKGITASTSETFPALASKIGGVVSAPGTNWRSTPSTSSYPDVIVYAPDKRVFVALVNNVGTGQKIIYSFDGVTWNPTNFNTAFSGRYTILLYQESIGRFVAAGNITGSGAAYSEDGVNWTSFTSSLTNYTVTASTGGNLNAVIAGYNSSGTKYYFTSTNGTSWTARTGMGNTGDILGMCYANGLYVAVGEGGFIATSTSGTSWTVRSSGTINDLRSVTWGKGLFVAVGRGSTIVTSPDGVTWTVLPSSTIPISNYLFIGVAYCQGIFVITASITHYLVSVNGTTWHQLGQNHPGTVYGLACGDGMFVASSASVFYYSGVLASDL